MRMRRIKKYSIVNEYTQLLADIQNLVSDARNRAVRSIDSIMTATYWKIGQRVVVYEQQGRKRAGYGENLLQNIARDLTVKLGRGFGVDNLERMRLFYEYYSPSKISAALMRKSAGAKIQSEKSAALMRKLDLSELAKAFPLSWTHYARLLRVKNPHARQFYEAEALRNGWVTRQLDRQIESQFYERTALSRNKAGMLLKGARRKASDKITPEEEIKNPYVLEFLNLKDEYSESELEEALIHHLESFLLELGGDFTFVGRQKRLRVGHAWYRVDLVFYHRQLRALVLIDLKIGSFTHADAGQMHLYLNYAREHWTHEDENPPVGLILCAEKDEAVAKYALEGLPSKVLASEYKTTLPKEDALVKEIERTKLELQEHRLIKGHKKIKS